MKTYLNFLTQAIQKLRDAGVESITDVRYLEDSDLQSLRFALPNVMFEANNEASVMSKRYQTTTSGITHESHCKQTGGGAGWTTQTRTIR